jgi:cytochrome P450
MTAISLPESPLLVPPAPQPPAKDPNWFSVLAAFRTDGLRVWPRRAYEEDVHARSIMGRRTFLLNDPHLIRQVLVDNDANYGRAPAGIRILRPLMGDGLLLSRGEQWRHQRQMLAPTFTPRNLPMLSRHIALTCQEGIERLHATEGVDLLDFLQQIALEIAGRSMFSMEMRKFAPELRDLIRRYNRRLGRPHLTDQILPVRVKNWWDVGRFWFARQWVDLMERLIEERRKTGRAGAPRDLFDLMDDVADPESGVGFTARELRDQVATMIMAGHETTALALFWACYLLVLDRESQERVAAEAQSIDLEPASAHEALSRLTFTRAVVQEALRLYPPAYVIVRQAIGPDELAGHPVPPGSIAYVAPWVLHRHRRLWRDPDVFDPRRFLPDAVQPDRFAYLPFGTGPRSCIGMQFALAEAVLVLAHLFRRFRVSIPAGEKPVMPAAVVTTQPDRAPLFLLSRR